MLGTLTAMAVERMSNLETFVWDMPTGVVTRVFQSLASLADQPNNECKLNCVSVRWHDITGLPNAPLPTSLNATVPQGSRITPVGLMIPENAKHPPPQPPVSYRDYQLEYPTFSILPPLQSLSVLDIDDVGYLDEMAVLIERSKDTIQELKVGISAKAAGRDFAQAWDGPELRQIDHQASFPGASTIGDRRLGGVLGVLVSKIYDIKQHRTRPKEKLAVDSNVTNPNSAPSTPLSTAPPTEVGSKASGSGTPASTKSSENQQSGSTEDETPKKEGHLKEAKATAKLQLSSKEKMLKGKLRPRILALERVGLSLHVCKYALDMTFLTHLTLLECAGHEHLWKMLRNHYKPTNMTSAASSNTDGRKPSQPTPLIEYHLSLRHLHTDSTTFSLISFIRETLAPNTLEVLFLQDRKKVATPPPVPLAEIFKGAIKRHFSSLKKLLIDSSAKPTMQGSVAIAADNTRWRHWTLNTEVMTYITSGRMRQLKELSVGLEYKDWHAFLQRLPNVPELRSFHMHHMLDYPGGAFDPKEMANQMTDIVTLRPEIKLCYMGMGNKCFELLEVQDTIAPAAGTNSNASNGVSNHSNGFVNGFGSGMHDHDTEEDDDGDGDDEEDEEDDTSEEDEDGGPEDGGGGDEEDDAPTTAGSDHDDMENADEIMNNGIGSALGLGGPGIGGSGGAGGGSAGQARAAENESDDDGWVEPVLGGVRLKMREILFYDDKVAIFKARHGRL